MNETPISSEFNDGDRVFDLKGAMNSGESGNFLHYFRSIEKVNKADQTVVLRGEAESTTFPYIILENNSR